MALMKWLKRNENGEREWISLYANAIINRLRRDRNLSDLQNPAKARENLQLTEEVIDHWHDKHYQPMFDQIRKEMAQLEIKLMTAIKDLRNDVKAVDDTQNREIENLKEIIEGKSVGVVAMNSEAALIRGAIIEWAGARDAIPDGWHICDGTDGTPDLSKDFTENVCKIMKL